VLQEQRVGAFASRVAKLLERIEYRRADTWEEKEPIFRMRYEAYTRAGHIEPNSSGLFTDPDDDRPNAWLIGIFIDGVLASSIRLHIASRPEHLLPVVKGFPDIVLPRLQAGEIIIDASRMTSRLEFARTYPFLPYIAIRSTFVAEDYFGADYVTAACREEYQRAYRRLGGAVNWAPARAFPLMTRKQALMAYQCKISGQTMRIRFPFLLSTPQEQRALFARSSNSESDFHAELMAGRRAARKAEMQHSTTYAA
jgi:N-acyl amino acid synthase FeeM